MRDSASRAARSCWHWYSRSLFFFLVPFLSAPASGIPMPDPKQMSGIPPRDGLPTGHVSVRLIRDSFEHIRAIPSKCMPAEVVTVKTDENGRAESAVSPRGRTVRPLPSWTETPRSQDFACPADAAYASCSSRRSRGDAPPPSFSVAATSCSASDANHHRTVDYSLQCITSSTLKQRARRSIAIGRVSRRAYRRANDDDPRRRTAGIARGDRVT